MSPHESQSWKGSSAQGGSPAKPSETDWRRGAAKGSRGPGVAGQKNRAWVERPDRSYEDALRWHRVKIASWVTLLVTLVGILVWWLVPSPKRTPLIALAVTDYAPAQGARLPIAIPPNGWAEEDIERFHQLDQKEAIVHFTGVMYARTEAGATGFQNLREEIRKLRRDRRKTMVIYLSMHGVVNDAGQPCLVLPGSSPYRSSQWLPLHDLLAYLFPKEDQAVLPPKKLLILDCNRIDVQWPMGLLINGFADRLEGVVNEAAIPGLVVFNSTSPNQVGWTASEPFHGSVFAHFLWQGLRGWADLLDEGGNGDGKISIRELHAYVRTHVRQWALENRADVQEPVLLPADADIPLVVYAKPVREESIASEKSPTDSRWTEVESLWRKHAELARSSPPPWRDHPIGWEEFQHKLLRLEQLVDAGNAYAIEFEHLRRRVEELAAVLADHRPPTVSNPHNLPLAVAWQADTATLADRDDLCRIWKARQKYELEPERRFSPLGASAAAWRLAVEGVAPNRWPELLKPIRQPSLQHKSDWVELHFLRMLMAHLDPTLWSDDKGVLKKAIQTRDLAEQAATPDDPRVQYWVRMLTDPADADRRLAEDALFVGSEPALREADTRLTKVGSPDAREGSYQAALARAKQVAGAYALRDRAWQTIPYLAQWLFARLHTADSGRIADLQALTQGTHELGAELDRAIVRGAWTPALETAVRTVGARLQALTTAFDQECSQLWEAAGADPKTLRGIGTVLAVPLVTGEQRNRLRRKFLEIAGTTGALRGAVAQVADAATAGSYVDRLTTANRRLIVEILSRARIEAVDEPIAVPAATKHQAADTKDPRERLQLAAQDGERARQLLDAIVADADKSMADSMRRLSSGDKFAATELRSGLSKADRLVRACAPLLDLDPTAWNDLTTDPTHQLRRLDLHYFLLWQARRVLDDFWGPPPDVADAKPFFQDVAGDYLEAARQVLRGLLSKLRDGDVDLSELLQNRVAVAQSWMRLKAEDVMLATDDETAAGSMTASPHDQMPPGKSAVFARVMNPPSAEVSLPDPTVPLLSQPQVAKSDLRRLSLALPASQKDNRLEYWVRTDEPRLAGGAVRAEAVALFRGHVQTAPFSFQGVGKGVQIVHERAPYPPPTVTVKGNAVQECPILFVVDFSGSMETKKAVFQTDARGGKAKQVDVPRFEIAVDSLCHILKRLESDDGRYLVGLRVYGHRVGWRTEDDGRTFPVVWDPKRPGTRRDPGLTIPKPPDFPFLPNNDIELKLSLGRLGRSDAESVQTTLDMLRPLGETPLYLAIEQAIGDLNARVVPPQAEGVQPPQRHIVVITDGVDDTSDNQGHRSMFSDIGPLQDKFRASENKDIRLDIVGFDLDADAQTRNIADEGLRAQFRQQVLRRFEDIKSLAASTGDAVRGKGRFFEANDPGSLVQALEQSLELKKYQIRRKRDNQLVTPEPVDINNTTTVRQEKNLRVPYEASILDPQRPAKASFDLEGGEALELYLSEDWQRLEHRRYDDKDRRGFYESVGDPEDPQRRFYIAAYVPRWEQNNTDLTFFFSIQNANEKEFSPRPAEAWVQIKAVLPPGSQQRNEYNFFDLEFKPGLPVPMLVCRATHWPAEAREAEVQLWFRMKRTPAEANETIPVADFRRRGGVRLASIPGVQFDLETRRGEEGSWCRVIVIERHPPDSTLDQARVEMDGAYSRVIHHYTHQVRHTFYFDDTQAAAVDNLTVTIVPRSRIIDRAIALPRPFQIVIPKQSLLSR